MNSLEQKLRNSNTYLNDYARRCKVSYPTFIKMIRHPEKLDARVTLYLASMLEMSVDELLRLAFQPYHEPEQIINVPEDEISKFIGSHFIEGRPTADVYDEFNSLYPDKYSKIGLSRYICKRGGFCVKVKRDGETTRRYYAVKD